MRSLDRSAYLTAPMPTASAIAARSSARRGSALLLDDRAPRRASTASSSRSMRRTVSPARVRSILRSSPSTLPNGTCSQRARRREPAGHLARPRTPSRSAAPGARRRRRAARSAPSRPTRSRTRGEIGGRVAEAAVGLPHDERQRLAVAVGEPGREDDMGAVALARAGRAGSSSVDDAGQQRRCRCSRPTMSSSVSSTPSWP